MGKGRLKPKVAIAPIPEGFGQLLADNFDWWEESLDLTIPDIFWTYLTDKKQQAIELDSTRCTPISIELSGAAFQLLPTGAKGGREFVIFNDSYRIEMASPAKHWCIKWRAMSAALWSIRLNDLRETLYELLKTAGCEPKTHDWQRLSRADYCFDIHSAAFTREMYPRIVGATVCPSETKVMGDFVVQSDKVETLTIGKGSSCQVQIYNKSKEITEASNKTWLYDIWAFDSETGEVGEDILSDVWRVEIRLKKHWLKFREGSNLPDSFQANIQKLLADALYNRRLCKRTRDSNRRRWPLHPLYGLVLERIGNPSSFVAIDRRATGRRSELIRIMRANIAGSLRALETLENGSDEESFDEDHARELMISIFAEMMEDEKHRDKIRKALERYELVNAHR